MALNNQNRVLVALDPTEEGSYCGLLAVVQTF